MNYRLVCSLLALALATIAQHAAAGNSYCPLYLQGQMGGTYYYYSAQCCDSCGCGEYTVVGTSSAHTTGGSCPGCGAACNDPISMGEMRGDDDERDREQAIEPGANEPDPKTKARPPLRSQGVTYADRFVTEYPEDIKQGPTTSEVTLEFRGHYFRCLEIEDQHRPGPDRATNTYYIAHELKDKPINPVPAKCLGGSNGHYRLTSEDGTDERIFDALSISDLGVGDQSE
jgi:hypothetical protein